MEQKAVNGYVWTTRPIGEFPSLIIVATGQSQDEAKTKVLAKYNASQSLTPDQMQAVRDSLQRAPQMFDLSQGAAMIALQLEVL